MRIDKRHTLAASVLLALTTFGSGAWADSVIEIDDALATRVQREIQRLPPIEGHSLSGISVRAMNGLLRLEGFVEGLASRRAVNDVLKNVEGLHMDQVDDHLIQQ